LIPLNIDPELPEITHMDFEWTSFLRESVEQFRLDKGRKTSARDPRILSSLDGFADPTDQRLPAPSSPDDVVAPVHRENAAPSLDQFDQSVFRQNGHRIPHRMLRFQRARSLRKNSHR
jgi:hypothetical protein